MTDDRASGGGRLRASLDALTGLGRRRPQAAPSPDQLAAKIGYLRETDLFAPLSDAEQTWLMQSTTMVTCDSGHVFYTPDQTGEVVFILKKGRVNIYRIAPDGRKLVVATIGPGTIFGEMSLIGQGLYGCFAEASEPCLLCVLSRFDLQQLIRRNPDVALRFLDEIGGRLRERERDLERLAFQALPSRLAALLLSEAGDGEVVTGLTHEDLAQRLGTYRETVSQTLGKFRRDGWVNVQPRRIELNDRPALYAIAGEAPPSPSSSA